jgi:hypothetical protein
MQDGVSRPGPAGVFVEVGWARQVETDPLTLPVDDGADEQQDQEEQPALKPNRLHETFVSRINRSDH